MPTKSASAKKSPAAEAAATASLPASPTTAPKRNAAKAPAPAPVEGAPENAPENVPETVPESVAESVAPQTASPETAPTEIAASEIAAPGAAAPDAIDADIMSAGEDEREDEAVSGGVEVAADDAEAEAAAPAQDEDEEEEEVAPRRPMTHSHGMGRPGMGGRVIPAPRAMAKAEIFVEGDHVVYPTHGVGKVERIATEEIAGHRLELIHITFEENRMTLRVPVAKARTAGLRKLATRKMFDEAMAVLKGRARIKRTMWSRRAQEYEAKINSGDPLSIAEVVRDLHRNAGQPDQSFSERQIYEAAMDRLAAELAALDQIDKSAASVKLSEFLKTV